MSEQAVRALREALKLSPDNLPLRQHLAETLLGLARFAEAEQEYRQALALAPDSQPVKLGLARAFYQQGKNSQALVLVEDLLRQPDTPAGAYALHARLLLRAGEVERAVRDVSDEFGRIAPRVLSLEPNGLDDILATIRLVGAATGSAGAAGALVDSLRGRIERVRAAAASVKRRPRVACIEWLDPIYGPGHWLPELVELAGGQPGLGTAHADSRRIAWGDVIAFAPEAIVVTPCGFDLASTVAEALRVLPSRTGWDALPAVRHRRVYAVDGNAYFSRPGPRIVDSLELLAELIHPEIFAGWGPYGAWQQLVPPSRSAAGR